MLFISSVTFAQIENVGLLNSPADELNPVVSPDGRDLYFIRKFDPLNEGGMGDPGDIWVSHLGDSSWNTPVRMPKPFNNRQFNGLIAFLDAENIYLYEHYKPGGSPSRTQGISYTSLRNTNSTPARVDVKYFYNKSDHISIALSPDGSVMVLTLESYGTKGAEDLYVSFKTGRTWSEPKNMGEVLNTSMQEMTPYIAPDSKTLFFASNGHGGFGGRDIFMTQRLDESWLNWTQPVNMGERVNTEGIELYFYYLPFSEKAVYTSTTNSDGHSDLKVVSLSEDVLEKIWGDTLDFSAPTIQEESDQLIVVNEEQNSQFLLKGYVRNENDETLNATLTISGKSWSEITISNPVYEIVLPGGGIYEIVVESEGYVSKQEILDLRASEIISWNHDFTLQRIAVGVTVNLDNVLFVQGSTELLESSGKQLDLVVGMMKDNQNMKIHLSGHTDNQGNQRLNKILSQQRVDRVITYLIDHGIVKDRLTGEGFGGGRPIASNESEETRKLNRRVEFTIISYQ